MPKRLCIGQLFCEIDENEGKSSLKWDFCPIKAGILFREVEFSFYVFFSCWKSRYNNHFRCLCRYRYATIIDNSWSPFISSSIFLDNLQIVVFESRNLETRWSIPSVTVNISMYYSIVAFSSKKATRIGTPCPQISILVIGGYRRSSLFQPRMQIKPSAWVAWLKRDS